MGKVTDTAGFSAAAETLMRLAVLLQAGAAPGVAWRYLAETGNPAALRIAARSSEGTEISEALRVEGGAWNDVAAAWHVADTVGAPLAMSLRRVADVLDEAEEAGAEINIALSEPRATSRLVSLLPLAALLLGGALGFDTMSVLLTNPIGWFCATVGILLIVAGARWTRRIVQRAEPSGRYPGLHAELMSIALAAGVGVPRAREVVAAASTAQSDAEEDDILMLSGRVGIPAAELLRAYAVTARRRYRTENRMAIARLGPKLVLPLGICTLPAFVFLGVAPLLLSILTSTPLGELTPLAP